MSRKKIATLIIVVLIMPVAALAAMFVLLQSSFAVNVLAVFLQPVTGISLHVDNISLNRHLDANVSGLHIKAVKENGFDISLAKADVKTGVGPGLKVKVEKVLLTGPKFTFYIKKTGPGTDPFAVFKKMPPVHLLEVKNGQLEFKSDSSVFSIPGMDVNVWDFEPKGGGKLNGKSHFDISYKGMTASGDLEATLDLSRFFPRPSGSGSFRLSLDTGSLGGMRLDDVTLTTGLKLNGDVLSFDGTKVSIRSLSRGKGSGQIDIRDIKTKFNVSYDQKTSEFFLTAFEGSGDGVGILKGRASGGIKPLIWDFSLHSSSMDLAKIFGILKPLLPETYRNWTFKGTGGLEVKSKGRSGDGIRDWKATVVVDLSKGGFASADNSKAGERISGKIEIKLSSPDKMRKSRFNVTLEGGDGEVLWDQYYQDFKGEKARVVSQGIYAQNPASLYSSGTFDLFQTGHYTFSMDRSPDRFVFSLDGKGISCQRLFTTFMHNYFKQNYPNLQDITLEGESDLRLTASISKQQKMIKGRLALRGGALSSPSNNLRLTGLNLSLPYDLTLAGKPSPATGPIQGFLSLERFKKGNIRIGKIMIPVTLSGRLIAAGPIAFSIFGGEIRLAGFRVENFFSPEIRVETAMTIKHFNLGDLIGETSSFSLPGRLDGDLSSIVFKKGKWTSTGGLVAQIFGGQVNIEHLFAGRLFSSSRFFGADAVFDHMDLGAATENIKVGRMTGLVKGSLKNFMMEYGQPARFDLVITSDKSRNVTQKISVEAIKNISMISTGSGAISGILNSGLNRFFKEYPYSQIGIRCTLADDVFSLRGLIHEGGNEYLVRRGWFRGIDIINKNPDNFISFKDMSERVGRLFQPRPESKNAS
jgi:hypothetical protein